MARRQRVEYEKDKTARNQTCERPTAPEAVCATPQVPARTLPREPRSRVKTAPNPEVHKLMSSFRLTDHQLCRFNEDGFLVVEALFDDEEIDLLRKIAKADHQMTQKV